MTIPLLASLFIWAPSNAGAATWSVEVANVRTQEVRSFTTSTEKRFTAGAWSCTIAPRKRSAGTGPGQYGADLDCTRTLENIEIMVGTQSSSCLVRAGKHDSKSYGALRLSLLAVDPNGPSSSSKSFVIKGHCARKKK